MKVFSVPLFDGLARILTKVEQIGVWPEHQRPLFVLLVVFLYLGVCSGDACG